MITVMLVGTISLAEAHPHISFDLMVSHSHDINDEGFVEHFFIHTFEPVSYTHLTLPTIYSV